MIIPSNDTTYWCESTEISEDLLTSTKYIIRVINNKELSVAMQSALCSHAYMTFVICVLLRLQTSPRITPHARSFVHHMLIYFCPYALDASLVGVGGPCSEVHPNITGCLLGLSIGAWAVGGEVSIITGVRTRGAGWGAEPL